MYTLHNTDNSIFHCTRTLVAPDLQESNLYIMRNIISVVVSPCSLSWWRYFRSSSYPLYRHLCLADVYLCLVHAVTIAGSSYVQLPVVPKQANNVSLRSYPLPLLLHSLRSLFREDGCSLVRVVICSVTYFFQMDFRSLLLRL